jgi:hypothetical protein
VIVYIYFYPALPVKLPVAIVCVYCGSGHGGWLKLTSCLHATSTGNTRRSD